MLRDAEHHALVREICDLRYGPPMAALGETLGAKLNVRQRAMLHLALSFFTWRTLADESGLPREAAVNAMVRAIGSAGAVPGDPAR